MPCQSSTTSSDLLFIRNERNRYGNVYFQSPAYPIVLAYLYCVHLKSARFPSGAPVRFALAYLIARTTLDFLQGIADFETLPRPVTKPLPQSCAKTTYTADARQDSNIVLVVIERGQSRFGAGNAGGDVLYEMHHYYTA